MNDSKDVKDYSKLSYEGLTIAINCNRDEIAHRWIRLYNGKARHEAIEICKKQQQGISKRILTAYFSDVITLRDNISLMNHFLLDRVIKYLEATINE